MNYFLLSLLLFINQNDAEDISPKNNTHWNDSFAVNIGAGYEVGTDQSLDLPVNTTKIIQPQNYLSTILSKETTPNIRESRTFTNFTPQDASPNLANMKNQFKFKNQIVDSRAAASNYLGNNNIQSYQVHEAFSEDDKKYANPKPSLKDLHNIVNGLEKSKQYSKIVQVIKVPAIYEIHLQSDVDKKNHVNLLPGGFNHNENSNWKIHENLDSFNLKENSNWKNNYESFDNFNQNENSNWKNHYENPISLTHNDNSNWKNHYENTDSFNHNENLNWKNQHENKPSFNNLNTNEHSDWRNQYEKKPTPNYFNRDLLSDEYLKWLNNYYKQREDGFKSKGPENYHTPSQENDVKPEWIDHLQENEFLEPIISHHYKHTQIFDDKFDDKGVFVNYNFDGKRKIPINSWQYRGHLPHRNVHYANSNLKRDIRGKNFNLNSSPYGTPLNNFPQNTKLLNVNHNKLNLKSKPIKQNQEITKHNHPEAIHEVPAPYLGKHSYPRPFEAQSFRKTDTYSKPLPNPHYNHNNRNHVQFNDIVPNLKPKQTIHGSSEFSASPSTSSPFDKHSDVFPDTVYGLVSEKNHNRQYYDRLEPETVPTSEEFASYINENQNLVYGKQTEAVLSPYEINIPVTTSVPFSDNQVNKIHNNIQQPFDYPDINVNNHRSSNYGGLYTPNHLQRVSNDQVFDNQFKSKDCIENNKFYENVSITTHIPNTASYSNNNQETFNKKSNTNTYTEENVKDKSQNIKNIESKENLNSTKRMSEHEYKNFVIKESSRYSLLDKLKNIPKKLFAKNNYMNKSPLEGMPRKQNNSGHLDYIIYIREKTSHEDDKLF